MKEKINYQQQEDVIDIIELLNIYLKKLWIIIICGIVGGLIAFLYTLFAITPLYQASVSVYVNNVRGDQYIESVSSANLSTSQMLVNTYVNIISSNTVLNRVIEEAKLPYTVNQIREMLSSSQVNETEIFHIYITHPNPEEAAYIANSIAVVAPTEIEKFVSGSSCKIIDNAIIPTVPISPNVSKNVALGGIIGIIIVVGVLTLQYLFDTRIKNEEDLNKIFNIPILGQIPSFTKNINNNKKSYVIYNNSEKSLKNKSNISEEDI